MNFFKQLINKAMGKTTNNKPEETEETVGEESIEQTEDTPTEKKVKLIKKPSERKEMKKQMQLNKFDRKNWHKHMGIIVFLFCSLFASAQRYASPGTIIYNQPNPIARYAITGALVTTDSVGVPAVMNFPGDMVAGNYQVASDSLYWVKMSFNGISADTFAIKVLGSFNYRIICGQNDTNIQVVAASSNGTHTLIMHNIKPTGGFWYTIKLRQAGAKGSNTNAVFINPLGSNLIYFNQL